MKSNDVLFFNNSINDLLNDYYKFLNIKNICSNKSIEYLHYIVKILGLENYVASIDYDFNLPCNGIYDQVNKRILLNINELLLSYKIKALNFEQIIVEYLTLIFHEFNHALQNKVMFERENSCISDVLKLSKYLKEIAGNKRKYYHDLFPDEIDSNIKSGLIVNEFFLNNRDLFINHVNLERNLIYYLSLGYINNGIMLPVSQISFLCSNLLKEKIEEEKYKLKDFECLLYGFKKSKFLNDKLLKSYQTQRMCFDIYMEEKKYERQLSKNSKNL